MKNVEANMEEVKISELREELEQMKTEWSEITAEDPDYDQKEDIFLAAVANLEDEIKGVKDSQKIDSLDIRKRARIFSDMQLLSGLLYQFTYDEDLDEDFDEDEEYEDLDEEE